ncbi:hypothetical protein GH714_031594 [Hevea brasiliensis]|uniref:Sister chromatid cohesion protein n=1 Tax=Hevea brasiliensis TaxID=3981 RepID=A0A6A6LD20_HEVBR|nr:hypothetical protein GH714_031594 [Hevea brasiliensis]
MSYSNSNPTASASGWSSGPRGIGLSNTIHSEVAPCLPLPSLPVFCGASDPHLRLFDDGGSSSVRGVWSLNRSEILAQSARIADLLRETDVSYFFSDKKQSGSTVFESKPIGPSVPVLSQDNCRKLHLLREDQKSRRRALMMYHLVQPDPAEIQDATIGSFCDVLEDFCGRSEIMVMNGVKQNGYILVRLLRVLDNQIHRAEGLSVDECEHDSDAVSLVFCALESIHAALAVMAHNNMPKQLYKEENIERILEFSKHQIMDVMSAYDPSYRALHKPSENVAPEGDEDEELETEYGSASKRRRTQKSSKLKKSAFNKVSGAVNTILQKLCTVLGLLKDLLLIERLSDSCILQLVKTSFTTFLVDNIQLLQLKAIGLISGIFYSYAQHRAYVIDEVVQLLLKLPFSKRAVRAYHLPDEEQRQIQMISALLIQLVHSSANLPDPLREASSGNSILEVSLDATYPTKCHEAVTETCCLFWTRVLQRFATVKNQDASEMKVMMENLVADLLTTLNLPEYPASAPILEVLCVLLLQNAGLKSKDISARSLAIDILGTIATRLKQDAVICGRNKFWILMELTGGDNVDQSYPKDACCVCFDGRVEKTLFMCQGSIYAYGTRMIQNLNRSSFTTLLKSNLVVRDTGTTYSKLMRDSAKKITSALGQNSSFCRGFDKILHMLLASLRENSPVIRAKALRAVSIIVEADPEVLCDKRVQWLLKEDFVTLQYLSEKQHWNLLYFEKVAERIKDTGVSVRKRAIKIIRDMCTSNASFSEFTTACIEIISRISDDESSIQDLVCKTFYEFWFEEPSGLQTQYFGDSSSVPLEVAKKTEQIVEMLRKMPSHQLLVTVIKRNLALDFFPQSAKAVGINPVSLASVRKRCELMCKCLLERILQVEEMSSEEVEGRTLPYVLALHAFCVVDATLCAPGSDPSQFVVTLQPYLKSQVDNRAVAQLLENFQIYSSVDLVCLDRCLCSLSRVAGKGAAIVEYLIQLVCRSLFCLGLLIRYGNSLLRNFDVVSNLTLFKKYLRMEDFGIKVRSLQALGFVLIARPEYMLEKDIGKILEATLSSGSDVRLKIQALQNMYEYLLDAESQMGTDKASNDVNHHPVEGGHSVPVAAGAGDTNICGGIVQLYWDNILGRCLDFNEQVRQTALKIVEVVLRQGLVHPITCVPYLIALETDPQELNSKLAHHLLMNMNEKYPAFFESRLGDGLQLSFIFMQSCSVSAENLNQKLQSRAAGNLKGKPEGGSLIQARLGVSRIYKLIRGNRISRNKFMSSIVRKFDNPSWTNSVIPFLMYCTEVLAMLPFTSPDEPLYLIYAINRIIQVRAGALEANMKGLILHLSQRNSGKLLHENGVIQQEPGQPILRHMATMDLNGVIQQEPVAQPNFTPLTSFDLNGTVQEEPHLVLSSIASREPKMDKSSANSFSISNDDVEKIQVNCLWAIALQLLLKLKRHLKVVYSLNDTRCQAFSPNEPPKTGEALSRQNIPFDISETSTSVPSTYQDLVQRYQEFKGALKEDSVDYTTYTANIKRKRPTPRKTKNARVNGDDDDDDDDDAEWTGGVRRQSGSGRRGNYNRAGRQRS